MIALIERHSRFSSCNMTIFSNPAETLPHLGNHIVVETLLKSRHGEILSLMRMDVLPIAAPKFNPPAAFTFMPNFAS